MALTIATITSLSRSLPSLIWHHFLFTHHALYTNHFDFYTEVASLYCMVFCFKTITISGTNKYFLFLIKRFNFLIQNQDFFTCRAFRPTLYIDFVNTNNK